MAEQADPNVIKKAPDMLFSAFGEDEMPEDNEATKAVELPVTLDWYRDSVKWMVGFAALGLAGAAQAYVKVQGTSDEVKAYFVALVSCYTLALIFGAVYYRKLTYFGNQYEYFHKLWLAYASREEYKGLRGVELSYPEGAPDFLKPSGPLPTDKFFIEAQNKFLDAKGGYKPWAYPTMISLGIAAIMTAIALGAGVYAKVPDQPPPVTAVVVPPHYVMVTSGVHRGSDGRPTTHDFLVSETTGEVWQMVCDKGNIVKFVRISVEGLPKPISK